MGSYIRHGLLDDPVVFEQLVLTEAVLLRSAS